MKITSTTELGEAATKLLMHNEAIAAQLTIAYVAQQKMYSHTPPDECYEYYKRFLKQLNEGE